MLKTRIFNDFKGLARAHSASYSRVINLSLYYCVSGTNKANIGPTMTLQAPKYTTRTQTILNEAKERRRQSSAPRILRRSATKPRTYTGRPKLVQEKVDFSVRLESKVVEMLKDIAWDCEVTVAVLIRIALDEYINREYR